MDDVQALFYYQKAADQYSPTAENNLGWCCEHGIVVTWGAVMNILAWKDY